MSKFEMQQAVKMMGRIEELEAQLKATEQQLDAVANEWDNERKNYQEAMAQLKEAMILLEIAIREGDEMDYENYERIDAIINEYKEGGK